MTGPTRPGDALSDTQRRFLVAVMERLPRELVHEIYLFAPMKQGSVETGIAVVAMGEAIAPDIELSEVPPEAGEQAATEHGEQADVGQSADEQLTVEPADTEPADTEPADMPHLDVQTAAVIPQDEEQEVPPEDVVDALVSPVMERPLRYTIHTARYRLQLKGPERGRWDVDVVEEADAPLVTVDAVVRGVHRRSGEPSEVERLAPHDLARALGEIPWTSEN